jgi:hypothetical protein
MNTNNSNTNADNSNENINNSNTQANDKFNKFFVTNMKKMQNEENEKEQQKLTALNNKNSIYKHSIFDLLIGINNTFFGMLNDIVTLNFTADFFTKDNRLFFIGLLLIIIALSMLIYNHIYSIHFDDVLTEIKKNKDANKKIVNVYNVYNNDENITSPNLALLGVNKTLLKANKTLPPPKITSNKKQPASIKKPPAPSK